MTRTRERRATRRGWTVLVATALLAVMGTTTASAAPGAAGSPALRDAAPCAHAAGFTCSTLRVPLDHSGRASGHLDLQVATADNTSAPRGVLLVLTGGPGQPGVPFVSTLAQKLAPVLHDYRLVMLDQRGTGAGALVCPALQRQVGGGDLTVPTSGAVTDCADRIGSHRRYFATADTVADLDQLRRALQVGTWSIDGVSYGTFVAERYALAHRHSVARLVLDSVVPQTGVDPFVLVPQRATGRVLTLACEAIHCTTDPTADLADVVRARHDGPALFDAITIYGFVDPNYAAMIADLHAAAGGDPTKLDQLVAALHDGDAATPQDLSQGLHASTLCADGRWPWGTAASPLSGRNADLRAAAKKLSVQDVYPFTTGTAAGNGELRTCLHWPPTPVAAVPDPTRRLPDVPVLMLGGDRDLSTPLEWLADERRYVPNAQVVIVPGAGHSIQNRATTDAGRQAVWDFLT